MPDLGFRDHVRKECRVIHDHQKEAFVDQLDSHCVQGIKRSQATDYPDCEQRAVEHDLELDPVVADREKSCRCVDKSSEQKPLYVEQRVDFALKIQSLVNGADTIYP